MLTVIDHVLTADQVASFRQALASATWEDGRTTAGEQSGSVKRNRQLPEHSQTAYALGEMILEALSGNNLFVSAALPFKIFPPLFNRYEGGEHFGTHVDNAIRALPGTSLRIRTDLSATLFLSEPEEYDGGELVIEDRYGTQDIKLPAGSMVLYPSGSLHHVTPVTRGARIGSFFWMQSMIRDNERRALLFELDCSIQTLTAEKGVRNEEVVRLTGVYHNLIRQWADCI